MQKQKLISRIANKSLLKVSTALQKMKRQFNTEENGSANETICFGFRSIDYPKEKRTRIETAGFGFGVDFGIDPNSKEKYDYRNSI